MAAENAPSSQTRIAAAAILARLQTAQSNVEQAVGQATGRAAQSLAAIAAHLASAESTLAQSLQSGGPLASLDLSAIERLIQTSETNAQAAVAAGEADAAASSAQAIAATTAATRTEVQGLAQDLYDRHIFDRDLKFASANDEAAYRADEMKRQQEIAADLAKHTPEGTLNAGGLEAGQMMAAAAHGATANAEFLPRWNRLVAQLHQQREAMRKYGNENVVQFDRQTREDIRTFLQRTGVPADQIEHVLASDDPLHAVTSYLSGDHARDLEAALEHRESAVRPQPSSPPSSSPTHSAVLSSTESAAPQSGVFGAVATLGNLHVTGISFNAGTPLSPEGGHGLPEQARATMTRSAGRMAP